LSRSIILLLQLKLPFVQKTDADSVVPVVAQPRAAEAAPELLRPVAFVRMRHARRYVLRVQRDGTLRVTIPRGGSRREAEQFVQQQDRWIARERQRVQVEYSASTWQDGTVMLLRGETTRINVTKSPGACLITYGDRRVTVDGAEDIRRAIERDLRELARIELIPRLKELAAQHGLRIGTVSIRNQQSRWGSCARNGNIALNFRLVQMPAHIRDYVLLHELMHLRQQNHSRRFWRLVASVYPAFREAERWLKSPGRSLF
jgi:predicted metal-dependent hydrolase